MSNFLLIGICIIAGWLLRRLRVLPDDAHKGINIWILYMAVPAMALKYIPTIRWSSDLLLPALMPVIVWMGSWLTFKVYSRFRPLDIATRTALTLTAGLGNTSFIGFPLIQGYFGESAMPIAIISDQITFVIMATVSSMMAMSASQTGNVSAATVTKKLLSFPPFIAFFVALILPSFVDFAPALPVLDKVAATLVPLALFSVGMQLSFEGWREELPLLSIGLGYKLVVAPAMILVVILIAHMKGLIPQISLFEAAVAPMITAGVLAAQYNLNPKLANLIVGIGILLSFLTTAIWWWVLSMVC